MMDADKDYVVVKLITGEQLLAIKVDETKQDITLLFPMQTKEVHRVNDNGTASESITCSPFCTFAQERMFTFPKTSVMFYERLHSLLVPYYIRMVNQYERMVDVPESLFREDEGYEDEPEPLTVEDVEKAVDRLAAIMASASSETETEGTFVEGNDTVH